MRRRKEEKGSTMLETIMYVGFLAMLGAMLASYVGEGFRRYKTGRVGQQLAELKKTLLNYAAVSPDYTVLNRTTCAGGNSNCNQAYPFQSVLPRDLADGRHALGGTYDVGCMTTPPEDTPISWRVVHEGENPDSKYLFYITFKNISKKACIELLTTGQGISDGGDLDTIIVTSGHVCTEEDGEECENKNTGWYFPFSFIIPDITNKHLLESNKMMPNIQDVTEGCADEVNNTITWIFS